MHRRWNVVYFNVPSAVKLSMNASRPPQDCPWKLEVYKEYKQYIKPIKSKKHNSCFFAIERLNVEWDAFTTEVRVEEILKNMIIK